MLVYKCISKTWNNKIGLLDTVVLVRFPYSPRVGGRGGGNRVGINVRGKAILDIHGNDGISLRCRCLLLLVCMHQ